MSVDDVTLGSAKVPAVVAHPATVRGGVVVLQEAFGLTSHIRSICERLAAEGYLAVAPALYHRDGAPVLGYEPMEQARPLMGHLNIDDMVSDITASLDFLT